MTAHTETAGGTAAQTNRKQDGKPDRKPDGKPDGVRAADGTGADGADVVELILADHRAMEDLFRDMRNVAADRAAALRSFADLLIAHAEAEEAEVYPALRRYKRVDDGDVEHGEEEHAEGNEALLDLLEAGPPGGDAWDEKLEALVEAVTHHLDEEERTLLNDARENVTPARRAELGRAFLRVRRDRLAAACGRPEYVRRVVRESSHG